MLHNKKTNTVMKIIIVGGVAGGATAAARIRRNTEHAEIILIEKAATYHTPTVVCLII